MTKTIFTKSYNIERVAPSLNCNAIFEFIGQLTIRCIYYFFLKSVDKFEKEHKTCYFLVRGAKVFWYVLTLFHYRSITSTYCYCKTAHFHTNLFLCFPNFEPFCLFLNSRMLVSLHSPTYKRDMFADTVHIKLWPLSSQLSGSRFLCYEPLIKMITVQSLCITQNTCMIRQQLVFIFRACCWEHKSKCYGKVIGYASCLQHWAVSCCWHFYSQSTQLLSRGVTRKFFWGGQSNFSWFFSWHEMLFPGRKFPFW